MLVGLGEKSDGREAGAAIAGAIKGLKGDSLAVGFVGCFAWIT